MKTVKLLSLVLIYFKGIQQFTIDLKGNNVKLFGDNGTGKTTFFDAFLYLLFDKDSNNKKDFAIKTLDANGKEMHNIEHTVEGVFEVDGVQTKFKKIYKEKWTKKRGNPTPEFSGHVVDHFVDDVPVAKGEYTKKVADIISEDVFKLLTSPTYFNEQLKWQERRALLIELAGDVSDEEVIASDKQLAKLNELLSGKSMEDMKKIVASKKKHINEQLQTIPVRIDELRKSIPTEVADVSAAKTEVAAIEQQIDELKTTKITVQNGAAIGKKRNELQQIDNDLIHVKREFEADSKTEVNKLEVALQENQGNIAITNSKRNTVQSKIAEAQYLIERNQSKITQNTQTMDQLRNEFDELKGATFEFTQDCTCPTCKQDLPVDQVEGAKQQALEAFNLQIANRKAAIKAEGGALKTEVETLHEQITAIQTDIENFQNEIAKFDEQVAGFQKQSDKLLTQIETAKTSIPDVATHQPYQELITKKSVLAAEINELEVNAALTIADLNGEIQTLESKRNELNAQIAAVANVATTENRIATLEAEQKQLADEYAAFEQTDYLIDQFTRKKVDLLNEKINAKFKYARFKMFNELINGGLEETCQTLYNGVPYGTGLNNAARINVGLDIINTLSEHYGLCAPIFIDNAEAVTKFIETDTQLISLIVSEQDKALRVEYTELEEAI